MRYRLNARLNALEELSKGQQPHATILGGSDSRVPPEGQARVREGVLKVVGAICDLASGSVRLLDPS
jgi:carbonic anhydrase